MRDCQVRVAGIDLISVSEVTIFKGVNEHGYASIKGVIEDKNEDIFIKKMKKETYAKVDILDEKGEEKTVFCGVITKMEIESTGVSKSISLVFAGATYLMDCVEKTRSFQDKTMSYAKLIGKVNAAYTGAECFFGSGQRAIGDLVVQYKESDWTFVKRLASHFNLPVIPQWIYGKISYSIGLAKGKKGAVLQEKNYRQNTGKDEYYYNTGNGIEDFAMSDAECYEVTSREILELGEAVTFQGKNLFVYEIQSRYSGEELLHTYTLRTENGFKLVKKYNKNLIGASLDASILAVQRDTVKLQLNVDETQDEQTAKWIAYSTVYSSADGTGWYCMPEKGDKVRLYFPNEKEEEGYVISSIHVGTASGSSSRSNPDHKSISNKYNKQIELTPTSITMTNNNGLSVCLDDEEGIFIVSNKQVSIAADEDLMVSSTTGKLDLKATDSIVLSQGNSRLTLKDDVILEGAKFLVQ